MYKALIALLSLSFSHLADRRFDCGFVVASKVLSSTERADSFSSSSLLRFLKAASSLLRSSISITLLLPSHRLVQLLQASLGSQAMIAARSSFWAMSLKHVVNVRHGRGYQHTATKHTCLQGLDSLQGVANGIFAVAKPVPRSADRTSPASESISTRAESLWRH